MSKLLRRQKAGYALSLVFCIIGVTAIFVVLWKTWPYVSSANNTLSAFWTLLWSEQLDLIPSIEFKLAYLMILGTLILVSGVVILALSRKWVYLPLDEPVLFQCSFCKKRWKGPRNQELTNCPRCRKQTYPRMVEH